MISRRVLALMNLEPEPGGFLSCERERNGIGGANGDPSRPAFVVIDELECAMAGGPNLERQATLQAVPHQEGLGSRAEPGGIEWGKFAFVNGAHDVVPD